MKFKNEDGEEIEAFSQEEVDQKINSEVEIKLGELKTEFENKISNIEADKKALEEKITGTKEDHPNFKVLKEALDKKDTEIQDFKKSYESDKKQTKTEFEDTIIKSVSKKDDEFAKKIKYHLDNDLTGMKDDTKENHQKKIEAAIKLASDNSNSQNIFDSGIGGGGRGASGVGSGGQSKTEFSASEKSLGAKLGIDEEDYKKYGDRITKK